MFHPNQIQAASILTLTLEFTVIFLDVSVATRLPFAGNDLTDYNITYIEGLQEHQKFVLADNLVVPSNETYHTQFVTKKCECRLMCMGDTRCAGSSSYEEGNMVLCHLTDLMPHQVTFQVQTGAQYMYKTGIFNESNIYGMQSDRLLYVAFTGLEMDYQGAVAFCKRLPGHRVGLFTKQKHEKALYDMVIATGEDVNSTNWKGFWTSNQGDETAVDQQAYDGWGFIPMLATESRRIMCQANPLGLNV